MDRCPICAYAAEYGWWGDALPHGWTHCYRCHQSWPGSQVWGHCTRCHTTFRGVRAFDAHQSAGLCNADRPPTVASYTYASIRYLRRIHDTGFPYYGAAPPPGEFPRGHRSDATGAADAPEPSDTATDTGPASMGDPAPAIIADDDAHGATRERK